METIHPNLAPLEGHEHPALFAAVQQLCDKAGLAMPKLHTFVHQANYPDPISHMMQMTPLATMFYKQENHIMFNEKILGLMHMNLAKPTDELKAVIGHELGHIVRKDTVGFGTAILAGKTKWAGLIAGLAVTHYLVSHKEKSAAFLPGESPHTDTPERIHSPTLHAAATLSKYLLGAVLGTTGGVALGVLMRHRMEFACDTFSKELMGSGEPLARAFTKFKSIQEHVMKNMLTNSDIQFTQKQIETIEKIVPFYEILMHPSLDTRIAALGR